MGYDDEKNEDERNLIRIPPYHYIHVLDETSNVTRIEEGPQTFIRKSNEKVILKATKMIVVPPRMYCIVKNPVVRNSSLSKELIFDIYGQVKLHHADLEVRLEQEPFPLYPGEELSCSVQPLEVIGAQKALKLLVLKDFLDGAIERITGDEYYFKGPGTYIPRKEVEILSKIDSIIIKSNEAVRLRAVYEMTDRNGINRVAGEEWMIREPGAYLPGVHEELVGIVTAQVLTETTSIHVRALKSFTDQTGKYRMNGEEYLITLQEMESFIPDVYEEFVGVVNMITLNNRQYAIIVNPYVEGKPQFGRRKVVRGKISFFLQPAETLENGILDVHILENDEGIVLKAQEAYIDTSVEPQQMRKPGDRWMLKGPMDYIPTSEVIIEDIRKAIPLHQNEGIYVRNIRTGSVRAIIGQTYMLGEDEEKWEKNISPLMKQLLSRNRDATADRGDWIHHSYKTSKNISENEKKFDIEKDESEEKDFDASSVIRFQVPHNAAVQIYDYEERTSRVVFGPDLVLLGPSEEFTQISLSGGKPKKPNSIRSLALLLGPDFCSDVVIVETADHARLQLQVSYNWHFKVIEEDPGRCFTVPDFIGDMCKTIASKIRGSVSSVTFDDFHKNSATIIRKSAFGSDANEEERNYLKFDANNLYVTSIDIQSVEPIDQRTRDSLQKSVTLAIEITTQSQEATAKREAERMDQEAKGRLERQRILDDAEAEKARKILLELQADCSAVESRGQAKAEASSRIEALLLEAEASVNAAKLKADALSLESNAELERLSKARKNEIEYILEMNKLEIQKASEMANIEILKFTQMINVIGSDTLKSLASAPQEQHVKMMQSLGLTSTLITDGKTPINLLNTAQGLIGAHHLQ